MNVSDKRTVELTGLAIGVLAICILMGKVITSTSHIIPLAIVIGIFTFFVSFVHTEWALVLLIYSMLLSPELYLGAISKRDIIIRIDDLLIIIFSFAWLARTTLQRGAAFLTKTPINRYVGFYMAVCAIATLRGMILETVSFANGTFHVLKYLEYFLIFYIAANITKNKQQIIMYLKAFFITFAIVNIYAFIQIGVKSRVSAPFEGDIGEPNTLGGYQILLLALILGILTHVRAFKWRWQLTAIAGFSLIPFVYTLSRSSYFSIIPMYLTLIALNRSRTRNILISILFIVIILALFFFPQNVKDRIVDTFTPYAQETVKPVTIMGVGLGPSISARIHDWVRVFRYWKQKPYLGYGITGRGFLDSQFIRTLVELGAIGSVAFILLLFAIFYHTLKIYRTSDDELFRGIAIGFLAGHVGMIFHAISANTFMLIRVMEPYWFLAAIVMVIPKIEATTRHAEEDAHQLAVPAQQTAAHPAVTQRSLAHTRYGPSATTSSRYPR